MKKLCYTVTIIWGGSVKDNEKGQALIEFILILPIIILLLFGMIDIGRIFLSQSELENEVEDTILIWKKENTSLEYLERIFQEKNIEVEILENNTTHFLTIHAKQKITFTTPLLDQILKNYQIKVKRVIPYE